MSDNQKVDKLSKATNTYLAAAQFGQECGAVPHPAVETWIQQAATHQAAANLIKEMDSWNKKT